MNRYLVQLILASLMLGGCTTTEVQKMETLTGTITYFQRVALPPDAIVEVKLVELRSTGGNRTVVENAFAPRGNVPVPFSLTYHPRAIDPGAQYAVQARILSGGKPWYVTQTVNHQMRHGRIVHADVILQPAR